MRQVTIEVSEDKRTARLRVPELPQLTLDLTVTEIEHIVSELALARARMQPEVTHSCRPGQKVPAVRHPTWMCEPEALQGDSLLHVRDSRYGWLHFVLAREEARKLGRLLIAQADRPGQVPDRERFN